MLRSTQPKSRAGGKAGVAYELISTRLALPSSPWRGSSLVARHESCVHSWIKRQTPQAHIQLMRVESWKHESSGQPLSECVFVDINHQGEGKSARLCLWFNYDLPASLFWSRSWLFAPSNLLSLSLSLSISFVQGLWHIELVVTKRFGMWWFIFFFKRKGVFIMWHKVYVCRLRYPSAFSLQFSSCFMRAATNRAGLDSLQVFVKKAAEVPVLSFWC